MLSHNLYLRLDRPHVALFRFLLEGCEGLAMFTSLGSDAAGREVLRLLFAPGARAEVLAFLDRVASDCPHTRLAG